MRQAERVQLPEPLPCRYVNLFCLAHYLQLITCRSTLSSARQDGQDKRGPRGSQGKFRTHQEAARDRLTVRRACGQLSGSTSTVWRPVYYAIITSFQGKGGFGPRAEDETDRQEGQARRQHTRAQVHASLRTEASPHSARMRLNDIIATSINRFGAYQ